MRKRLMVGLYFSLYMVSYLLLMAWLSLGFGIIVITEVPVWVKVLVAVSFIPAAALLEAVLDWSVDKSVNL